MFQKKSLYYALPAILLSTLLVVAVIWAWTEPGAIPPGGNVWAPINIGNIDQTKDAGISVASLTSRGGAVLARDIGSVSIGTTSTVGALTVRRSAAGNALAIRNTGNTANTFTISDTGSAYMTGFQLGTTATSGYVLTTNISGVGTWQPSVGGGGGISGSISASQVAFGTAADTIGGDNNLWWDNTNKRLGIRKMDPTAPLHIGASDPVQELRFLTGIDSFPTEHVPYIATAGPNLTGRGRGSLIISPLNADQTSSEIIFMTGGTSTMVIHRGVVVDIMKNLKVAGQVEVAGQVKITGGSPGADKVLTSDANGLASWQAPSGGGGGGSSVMYLRGGSSNPSSCPSGWTQADYRSEYASDTRVNWVRTCYMANATCQVIHLRGGSSNPSSCPSGWTQADYRSEYASDTRVNWVRTCYRCQ